MELNKNDTPVEEKQNPQTEIVSANVKNDKKSKKLLSGLSGVFMVVAVAGITYAVLFAIMPKKTLQNSPQKVETASSIDSDIQKVIEEEHSATDELYSAESQAVEDDANTTKSLEENYGL